CMQALWSPFTF
nr:immunoglobulin light chain junction region [Macaca mulatta]MOV35094.1 immunoglobulin light chain junction region [Macaca mulatta]MOV35096.1 immunoglobulin light chain junction region [Macaca mulatta]MOV35124.1 immunoglobulin light chain junction region [Macaca mulatta]